jgi:hypothetical protein
MIMNRRTLYLFGLLAPVLFVFTAILGGLLRPKYSHITDTVSELFSPGSTNRWPLTLLYILFSVSLSVFGLGLLKFVHHVGEYKRIGGWGAYIFILVGALNILTATVFPQDPWGAIPTFPGEMHQIVSGIISLLSILYMLLLGIWIHKVGKSKLFLPYSLATIAGAIISGAWFATSVGDPMMGIAERAAIMIGFQWILVLSFLALDFDKQSASQV